MGKDRFDSKNNIEAHGAKLGINYEDFCNNPIKLLELFNVDHLGDNAQTSLIKGKKNSNISEISSTLPKNLKFLCNKGILEINSILEKSMELMEWHGTASYQQKMLKIFWLKIWFWRLTESAEEQISTKELNQLYKYLN